VGGFVGCVAIEITGRFVGCRDGGGVGGVAGPYAGRCAFHIYEEERDDSDVC